MRILCYHTHHIMEDCCGKLNACWLDILPNILSISAKIWSVLREVLKCVLVCVAFIILAVFAVMIVGFINDGIRQTNQCYSELDEFGTCLENGVIGWIYVVISVFFLILPISVTASFTQISGFIVTINTRPRLFRNIFISLMIMIVIGWIFLAPLIGLSFNNIKSGTHTCTSYLGTLVWCGIFGNFAMIIPTLLILIIRGIIYINTQYSFKDMFIDCLSFLLICCGSGNLCSERNNENQSLV